MTDTPTVDVVLAHPWGGHNVNDRLSLDPDDARRLVQAGAARYVADEPAAELLAPMPEDAPAAVEPVGDDAGITAPVTGLAVVTPTAEATNEDEAPPASD